jgi:hypothetical protein
MGANVTRTRAADDFAVIRARIEELRRERAPASARSEGRPANGPSPYRRAISGRAAQEARRHLLRSIYRRSRIG